MWYTVGSMRGGGGVIEVVGTQTMRESDAETIAAGTDSRELMARAARGIFESRTWRGPVGIVCGYGNNAGDGFALALLLEAAGIACEVILLAHRFSPDGAYFYGKCKENAVKMRDFAEKKDLSNYRELVDCIFGTGFRGTPEGEAREAIEAINHSGATVICADINSGLNGDNGLGVCAVRSDLTVSIGTYKSGHFLGDAKDLIAQKRNVDIGISIHGRKQHLIERADVRKCLPDRRQNSHKGTYGYVAIMGGCRKYAGAVKLANLAAAALRAGCGVATLIIPESIFDGVAPYLLESTAALMPERDGYMRFDREAIDCHLKGKRALALGMGWGNTPENAEILRYILQNYAISTVIDADGLNALAQMDLTILRETKCRVILTPHMGEMSRLTGKSVAEISADPIGVAEKLAREYGVCVLLKGACTVVTDGEETYLSDRGSAGMATAGSGDVLSGVLCGMLGYAEPTALTVAAAAYLTGRAGELADEKGNAISHIASDTVRELATAIGEILS